MNKKECIAFGLWLLKRCKPGELNNIDELWNQYVIETAASVEPEVASCKTCKLNSTAFTPICTQCYHNNKEHNTHNFYERKPKSK